MSIDTFEKYIQEDEKDVMKIKSRPKKIVYPELYDTKENEKIPKVFVVIPTDTNENFVKGLTYIFVFFNSIYICSIISGLFLFNIHKMHCIYLHLIFFGITFIFFWPSNFIFDAWYNL